MTFENTEETGTPHRDSQPSHKLVEEGIVVGTFTSRIKESNFAEMFVLGYLLRKNMASREIQTLILAGVKKSGRKTGGGGGCNITSI